MKKFIGVLSIVFAVSVVALLTVLHEEPEENETPDGLMQVAVVHIQPQSVTDVISGHGQVRPRWETTIASEVNGRVIEVSDKFLSGAEFSKGDVLAAVESTNYIAELESAKAALAGARRAFKEEKQRAKIASDNWKSSGLKGRPSDLVLRKPQLDEARMLIQSAQAAVERAEYNLSQTKITAPYDGVVVSRSINPGDVLQTGGQVGKIYDRGIYEIVIPLNLRDIARFPKKEEAKKVSVHAKHSNDVWFGTISRVEQIIDQQNRWQNVVIEVKDAKGLLPGTFVRADFEGHAYDNVLSIPESMPANNGYIWYVDGESTLQRFMPEILFQKDGALLVKSPFSGQSGVNVVAGQDVFLPDVKVDASAARHVSNVAEKTQ